MERSYRYQPSYESPIRNGTSLDHIESLQRIGITYWTQTNTIHDIVKCTMCMFDGDYYTYIHDCAYKHTYIHLIYQLKWRRVNSALPIVAAINCFACPWIHFVSQAACIQQNSWVPHNKYRSLKPNTPDGFDVGASKCICMHLADQISCQPARVCIVSEGTDYGMPE